MRLCYSHQYIPKFENCLCFHGPDRQWLWQFWRLFSHNYKDRSLLVVLHLVNTTVSSRMTYSLIKVRFKLAELFKIWIYYLPFQLQLHTSLNKSANRVSAWAEREASWRIIPTSAFMFTCCNSSFPWKLKLCNKS